MSNVNNYAFAKHLDQFKIKMLDPQIKRVEDANTIMHDPRRAAQTVEADKIMQAKYDNYKAWLSFYQAHYDEGMTLVKQHEQLVNTMSKVYDRWYSDISNEGKQEVELMSMQADLLCELMGEIYKELAPLKLPDMKPPQGLNLK